jgi:hypothetical protein
MRKANKERAAKLREILRVNYPEVKFIIRPGARRLHIHWTNGPSRKEVFLGIYASYPEVIQQVEVMVWRLLANPHV